MRSLEDARFSSSLLRISALTKLADESLGISNDLSRKSEMLLAILALNRNSHIHTLSACVIELTVICTILPLPVIRTISTLAVVACCLDLSPTVFTFLWLAEAHHVKKIRLELVSTLAIWVVAFDDFVHLKVLGTFVAHC